MNNQTKIRIIIPAAAAILLTFGRGLLLPFELVSSWVDRTLNIFVVVIAPWFALKDIYTHLLSRNIFLRMLFLLVLLWISVITVLGTSNDYWPSDTNLITLALVIIIASQISRSELQRVRHFILLLAGVFTIYAILFAASSLQLIFSGELETRLGVKVSPANVVAFPRVLYTLILTCLFSLIVEKKLWIKIYSAVMMIVPILIALASGGRGPMVGFFTAAVVLSVGLRMKKKSFYSFLAIISFVAIVYFVIENYLPIMQKRILEGDDSGRSDLWVSFLYKDITLFGRGGSGIYPHNIFLELLNNYGAIGLILFLIFFTSLVLSVVRCYLSTQDSEVLWAISLFVLQMVAQQLSLDIFYDGFWAAIMLQLGYSWDYSPADDLKVKINPEAGSKIGPPWIKHNRIGHQGFQKDRKL